MRLVCLNYRPPANSTKTNKKGFQMWYSVIAFSVLRHLDYNKGTTIEILWALKRVLLLGIGGVHTWLGLRTMTRTKWYSTSLPILKLSTSLIKRLTIWSCGKPQMNNLWPQKLNQSCRFIGVVYLASKQRSPSIIETLERGAQHAFWIMCKLFYSPQCLL